MILNYESEKDLSISHRERSFIKENLNRLIVKNVNLNQQAVFALAANNSQLLKEKADFLFENGLRNQDQHNKASFNASMHSSSMSSVRQRAHSKQRTR